MNRNLNESGEFYINNSRIIYVKSSYLDSNQGPEEHQTHVITITLSRILEMDDMEQVLIMQKAVQLYPNSVDSRQ